MKRYLPIFLLLVLISGGIWLASSPPPASEPGARTTPSAAVSGSGEEVTFLELGSVGCKPCEAMKPVMQAVESRYGGRVRVVFHDVKREPGMAAKYGVRLIPTQVFLLADGTEFFRHEGYFAEREVFSVLAKMGVR